MRALLSTRLDQPAPAVGLLVLRAVVGLLVAALHGWHKVAEGVAHAATGAPWPLVADVEALGLPAPLAWAWAASLAQFGGGLALAAGAATRPAGAAVASTMAVAVWLNVSTGGPDAELAALYGLVAGAFALVGGGPYALDRRLVDHVGAKPRAATLATIAALVVGPAHAQPAPASRPGYALMRQDEDWSVLRDPALRTDYADPLKHVPLGDGGRTFLWVGGGLRPFYEYRSGAVFLPPEAAGDGYLLHRTMVHAGLASDAVSGLARARAFVEIQSGLVAGKRPPPAPPDLDRLGVNQAFAEATVRLARGAGGPTALVRLGRQEIHVGAGRLVSVREGPNVRRGFDGALARVAVGARGPLAGWRAEAFAARPVVTTPGVFDDRADAGERFWGAVASGPAAPGHTLDLYYFGTDSDRAIYDQGAGPETRHTLGARWAARAPPGAAALRFDAEAAVQAGRSGPDGARGAVRAWTAALDAAYTLRASPLRPTLGLTAGVASGDRDPADPDLQTFRAPYPPGRYFGPSDLGPQNVAGLRPSVAVAPAPGIAVEAGAHAFWRASTADGLYAPPGLPLKPGGPSDARLVGALASVALSWRADAHTALRAEVARFLTGPFLERTPPGDDYTYAGAYAAYTF